MARMFHLYALAHRERLSGFESISQRSLLLTASGRGFLTDQVRDLSVIDFIICTCNASCTFRDESRAGQPQLKYMSSNKLHILVRHCSSSEPKSHIESDLPLYGMNNFVTNKSKLPQDGQKCFLIWGDWV